MALNDKQQDFLAEVLAANTGLTAAITTAALDAVEYQADRALATIAAIRAKLDMLVSDPNRRLDPESIMQAAYPQDWMIDLYHKRIKEEREARQARGY